MKNESPAEQLTLLPMSSVSARFQLSRATRERGLRHVAEIRQLLAEREAARTNVANVVSIEHSVDRAA